MITPLVSLNCSSPLPTPPPSRFSVGSVLFMSCLVLSCVFCCVCHRPLSCVPKISNFSGLSLLIAPLVFPNVYEDSIIITANIKGFQISFVFEEHEYVLPFYGPLQLTRFTMINNRCHTVVFSSLTTNTTSGCCTA